MLRGDVEGPPAGDICIKNMKIQDKIKEANQNFKITIEHVWIDHDGDNLMGHYYYDTDYYLMSDGSFWKLKEGGNLEEKGSFESILEVFTWVYSMGWRVKRVEG